MWVSRDLSYFCAQAMTTTVNTGFGSHVMSQSTGVLLTPNMPLLAEAAARSPSVQAEDWQRRHCSFNRVCHTT